MTVYLLLWIVGCVLVGALIWGALSITRLSGAFVCCFARHSSSCNKPPANLSRRAPGSQRQRTTLLTRFRRSSTSHAGSQQVQPIFSSIKPTPSSLYSHRGSRRSHGHRA